MEATKQYNEFESSFYSKAPIVNLNEGWTHGPVIENKQMAESKDGVINKETSKETKEDQTHS